MAAEKSRIGVYVCHCGSNIAGAVKVEEVAEYGATLPDAVVSKHYIYMCSEPAQEMIAGDIKEHNLNRVVIACCSPRIHEPTFQQVLEAAGLNPYFLEIVNLREHCSWVHSRDRQRATRKARDLLRMGAARARLLEPLDRKEIGVVKNALVIGGGVSGLRASLDLADRGFRVFIVEKSPVLGGRAARLYTLSPDGEKAFEVVEPLAEGAVSNPEVKVLLSSEVSSVDGFIGNFKVIVKQKPAFIDEKCDLCGECAAVCPVEVPSEYDYGVSSRKAIYLPFPRAVPQRYTLDAGSCNGCKSCLKVCPQKCINLDASESEVEIYTGTIVVATGVDQYEPASGEYGYGLSERVLTMLQLERLLDPEGPAGGEIAPKPKNVVFISCVGSRESNRKDMDKSERHEYCSRVCCMAMLKNSLLLKEKYPDANIYCLYRDMRSYGRGHEFYRKALKAGISFIQHRDPPSVTPDLKVRVRDVLINNDLEIPADLIVLATGITPGRDAHSLQQALRISKSQDGFFQEAHAKLRPVETAIDGIYLAGAAQGPKNVVESITSGSAAAAKAAIPLAKGRVELEPTKAFVVREACDGCAICIDPCAPKAIKLVEYKVNGELKKTVEVNDAVCTGCGVCAATCPKKGIYVRHFTLDQISAMIDALLE